MTDKFWSTSITNVQPDRIEIRGYDIVDLIGKVSFAEQIYLVITGNLPNKNVARVFEAILCAAIDHGAGTPSALAARTSISGGATLNGAAAVGLLTMGDHHGAAIENCMRAILELTQPKESEQELEKRMADLVALSEKSKLNFPGIGHRVHPIDPRVNRLKEIAEETGFNGNYVACIEKVSDYFSKSKKKRIPVNVDGITAALLCEIGFPIDFGNVVFMVSRIVGVFTQANEEKVRQKPMRHIDPIHIKYEGVPSRLISNKKD